MSPKSGPPEDVACLPSCPAAEAPYHSRQPGPATSSSSAAIPDVKAPLFALAVGVLGRGPGIFRQAHRRAEQVADRFFDHLAIARRASQLPGVGVDKDEQSVVVEHLFEMGDEPMPVGAVAGETPAPGGRKYPRSSSHRACGERASSEAASPERHEYCAKTSRLSVGGTWGPAEAAPLRVVAARGALRRQWPTRPCSSSPDVRPSARARQGGWRSPTARPGWAKSTASAGEVLTAWELGAWRTASAKRPASSSMVCPL